MYFNVCWSNIKKKNFEEVGVEGFYLHRIAILIVPPTVSYFVVKELYLKLENVVFHTMSPFFFSRAVISHSMWHIALSDNADSAVVFYITVVCGGGRN